MPLPKVLLSAVWRLLSDIVREMVKVDSAAVAPDGVPEKVKSPGLSVPPERVAAVRPKFGLAPWVVPL